MADANAKSSSSVSYRLSDEIRRQIADIQKATKISADALFREFVSAYEHENFGSTSYGAAMQNDLDAWAMHFAALQQLYTNAIRSGMDAKAIVTQELKGRIDASETALSGLREKLEKVSLEKKELVDQLSATKQSLDAAVKALDKAEEESNQAKESADAWKNSINTLTSQLKDCQEKVRDYDKLYDKCKELETELSATKAQNDVYKGLINKYMSDK